MVAFFPDHFLEDLLPCIQFTQIFISDSLSLWYHYGDVHVCACFCSYSNTSVFRHFLAKESFFDGTVDVDVPSVSRCFLTKDSFFAGTDLDVPYTYPEIMHHEHSLVPRPLPDRVHKCMIYQWEGPGNETIMNIQYFCIPYFVLS